MFSFTVFPSAFLYFFRVISIPLKIIEPPVGSSRRLRLLRKVDFPDPEAGRWIPSDPCGFHSFPQYEHSPPDPEHRSGSAAWSDYPGILRPGIFPATRGPVPDRGRHPGPGRRTLGNPAEMYAGACRNPGYIRYGLQRKGTSGSSKFVTILCWSIVGVKRLCVFLCFRNSREKCVNHPT